MTVWPGCSTDRPYPPEQQGAEGDKGGGQGVCVCKSYFLALAHAWPLGAAQAKHAHAPSRSFTRVANVGVVTSPQSVIPAGGVVNIGGFLSSCGCVLRTGCYSQGLLGPAIRGPAWAWAAV